MSSVQEETTGDSSLEAFEKTLQQHEKEMQEQKMQEQLASQEQTAEVTREDAKSDTETTEVPMETEDESPVVNGTENSNKRPAEENSIEEPPPKISKLDQLWTNAKENTSDFQAWVSLLTYVDQQNDLEDGRKAYREFFARYPYCYGYWKKFAELEKRKGDQKSVHEAFESGVNAIPLSVDLWVHYMDYIVDTYKETSQEDFVRTMFDRAIIACGADFKSDKIWEAYLNWERLGERWSKVTYVYDRLLDTPNSKYLQQWTKFQEHIKSHQANEVVSVEELSSLRCILNAAESGEAPEENGEAPPGAEDGGEAPPGVEEDGKESSAPAPKPLTEEENTALQQLILDAREKVHQKTSCEAKLRWHYEDGIKRPYFHVKPLEKVQLQSWREYLDFEIKQEDETRCRILFERCLIACALYEEFWLRYIHFIETLKSASADEIRKVYERACTIHLKNSLKLQLNWAQFEEEKGQIDSAIEIVENVQEQFPEALEPKCQLITIERRQGNLENVEELFTKYISSLEDYTDAHTCMIVRKARFIAMAADDNSRAVSYLVSKIAEVVDKKSDFVEKQQKHAESLYLALIDRALSFSPPKFTFVAEILEKCSKEVFDAKIRAKFAEKFVQFVQECCPKGFKLSEAGRILREVQAELEQLKKAAEEEKKTKSAEKSTNGHNANYGSSGYTQSSNYTMQTPPPSHPTNQPPPQTGGYSGGYNQNYQQGGGYPQGQYQNWGYQGQQGYQQGYNQQGWGQGYSNYYGQR